MFMIVYEMINTFQTGSYFFSLDGVQLWKGGELLCGSHSTNGSGIEHIFARYWYL